MAHSEHRFPAPSPNSARFGYAPDGALFNSVQLSTDAISALRKVWQLIRLCKQHISSNNVRINTRRVRPWKRERRQTDRQTETETQRERQRDRQTDRQTEREREVRLDSNDLG